MAAGGETFALLVSLAAVWALISLFDFWRRVATRHDEALGGEPPEMQAAAKSGGGGVAGESRRPAYASEQEEPHQVPLGPDL